MELAECSEVSSQPFNIFAVSQALIRELQYSWPFLVTSGIAWDFQGVQDNMVKSESDSYYLSDLSRQFDILDRNRYPVDTSLIHIESRKPPTAELFDVDSGRIYIHHCE
uniref:Uncharacterized protein n=1 Tax=Tanacetum cinerariifolium TaxID=118510 RepID=A0A699I2Z2_TANCI|nr:hypothetical protein [Tanacetum cinerariifolium]